MKKLNILLILLILFNSTFLYANTEEALSRYYQEDVFYPPEEELLKQGMTLESYIDSLKESMPKNRNSLSSVDNVWGSCPLSGNIQIPVLLVQFSDNLPTYSLDDFNSAFNSSIITEDFISVSKYWQMQSYGDLNIVYDIYNWTTLPHTYSYYSQSSVHNLYLVLDAISTFDPYIDFSQYDNDNDGRLDGLLIVYPGKSLSTSGINSQTRLLRNYMHNPVDGKYLGNTSLVAEKGDFANVDDVIQIELIAHEFAHVLGLPDLYAYGPSLYNAGPMVNTTMMSTINYAPQKPINLDVWSRYFLGWIDPITLTVDSPKEISLRSVNDYPDAVILRNDNMGPREFFIIENRYRNLNDPNNLDNFMFNSTSSLSGFLIYHVDENKIEFDYPHNWINWDRDQNYYDYTSWPGITLKENMVYSMGVVPNIDVSDFYNNRTHYGCDSFKYFDETARLCPYMYQQIFDYTTRTYSGVSNPFISVLVDSPPSQYTMTAKMLVGQETELPSVSPAPGFYSEDILITLSHADPSAIIYYTLDGSDPTEDSLVYTDPLYFSNLGPVTLKAVARVSGNYISDVLEANYSLVNTVSPPYSNISSGDAYVGQEILLFSDTNDAIIKYTLDGSVPQYSSLTYTSPIHLDEVGELTLKARAYYADWIPSDVSTYDYNVLPTPENKILSFGFVNDLNILETEIDHDQNLVSIRVSYDSYISNLVPQIEISADANITPDPSIPQNFYNNEVEYTVTSLLGSERTY
ncbi:MAG: M6 family metalloprotease domain-containing protein, partial [Candidatus Cloacimonetes bacterium]|nr:M6 family metalloprotease domain-containing protein [Candidatus Cloacimonadota bacterium]